MKLITDEKIRTKILRKSLKGEGFKLDSWVRCIHCGRPFQAFEMRVYKTNEDNSYVCCKFPKCDGTLIDIVDEEDEEFAMMFDKENRFRNIAILQK